MQYPGITSFTKEMKQPLETKVEILPHRKNPQYLGFSWAGKRKFVEIYGYIEIVKKQYLNAYLPCLLFI
jgi:hypothetical protein